jgi:hypothetical protein
MQVITPKELEDGMIGLRLGAVGRRVGVQEGSATVTLRHGMVCRHFRILRQSPACMRENVPAPTPQRARLH